MPTAALVLAVLALIFSIAALARANAARLAAVEAVTDARRRAANAVQEVAERFALLQRQLVMLVEGETLTAEMIEEGLCFRDVGPDQARELLSAGGFALIDVRTPEETAAGILPGATCIPMDEVEARLAEIPEAGPTLLYCSMGSRSAAVCEALAQRGYRRLHNLEGGISAWDGELERAQG